ncbi:MAG TPA: substrate-binding domain-containing protein [Syntrophomonadaceae bacterium]|jgi:tungstate transport system substrate-binding protein|nr:substrate-binding domain-containing protein [Syntrophomonadaceae bacterium]
MVMVFMLSLVGCAQQAAQPPANQPAAPKAPANPNLILATTTSTQDTGLLDVLVPEFEKQTGYVVKTVSVGTGAALAMGEKGEADVLLVHSPAAELELVEKGFATNRMLVMHNDFLLIGPADDPAGIKGMTSSAEALKKIKDTNSMFISRGDKSGTHNMELSLWKAAGITPAVGPNYQEAGQGMGATITIANQKNGYTLTDRGTYLAQMKNVALVPMVEGEKALLNIYHVMTVNPEKWPKVNFEGAKAFADFMVAPATQDIIKTFGVDKYGQPLFFPDAGKNEEDLGKAA